MRVQNHEILKNEPMNADIVSKSIDIRHAYGFAVQITSANDGTVPTGNFIIQASLDGVTWFSVSTDVYASTLFKNFDAQYYSYVRFFWDRTSGDATDYVSVTFATKGA